MDSWIIPSGVKKTSGIEVCIEDLCLKGANPVPRLIEQIFRKCGSERDVFFLQFTQFQSSFGFLEFGLTENLLL